MRAVVRAVTAAVRRRRLQSVVIGAVVLLSSGTALLALGLLIASNAPFDRAFAHQHGAHATANFDAAKASAADLTATAGRPGVTAAAGPFDTVSAQLVNGVPRMPTGLIVGRSDATSGIDRLDITKGTWLTGPGQIVLSRDTVGGGTSYFKVGSRITVDVAGSPGLEVVGIADSVTGTANAWVWPTQTDVLQAEGAVTGRQMLYRFTSAGSDAAVRAGLSGATAGLPQDAVTGSSTYLAVKLGADASIAPMVPFVVAFAVLGLVMSVLIVVNVVTGAVVAGFRTIGVQKALGFTPAQVVGVYAGQILAVCVPACLLGVGLGRLLAVPLMGETAEAYSVSAPALIPIWVDLAVLLGVLAVVGVAAVVPALRAGRLSAVQAITVGRAPRSARGLLIRRVLAATRLPRPVSFGLGTPFARPARSAVTAVAVLLGATTVVFAAGLTTSLSRVQAAFSRASAVPVSVELLMVGGPGGGRVMVPKGHAGEKPPDPVAVRAAIQRQPGTARLVGVTYTHIDLVGSTDGLMVFAYDGDASWTGYPLLAGRWYNGPDEVVAGSRMLRLTGTKVGDFITISSERGQRRVHVVGEVFGRNSSPTIIMDAAGLGGVVEQVVPNGFEVALTGGTDPHAYVDALTAVVGDSAVIPQVTADTAGSQVLAAMLGLIVTLSLLLAAVAALGVFNTVVLNTRERVHEIGVLKSIGMTPGQVRTMVVMSMVVIGVIGGAVAVPLGWGLHRWIMPAIGGAAGTGIPAGIVTVYTPAELIGLGASGVALAVLGALVPAGWAARTRVATALRAE